MARWALLLLGVILSTAGVGAQAPAVGPDAVTSKEDLK
jgi:hypothetical protein